MMPGVSPSDLGCIFHKSGGVLALIIYLIVLKLDGTMKKNEASNMQSQFCCLFESRSINRTKYGKHTAFQIFAEAAFIQHLEIEHLEHQSPTII